MKRKLILPGAMASALLAPSLHAATTFSDNFDTGFGSNWNNTANGTHTVDHVNFNGGSRNYLQTLDTDYNLSDFTASVRLMRQGSGGSGTAFFGIGPGIPSAPAFGEPATAPVIYMRLFGESFTSNFADTQGGTQIDNDDGAAYNNGTLPDNTYVTFTLNYIASTQTATFSWDTGLGLESVSASNINLNASNSRIFFGGDAGVQADDFNVTVVPEPSAVLLGGLGILGLLRRRRN